VPNTGLLHIDKYMPYTELFNGWDPHP
jgi:hypothetical protein